MVDNLQGSHPYYIFFFCLLCVGLVFLCVPVGIEDFENYPMTILHDLHSDVQTLKDEVGVLLSKTSVENQENIGFLRTVKVLMKKNSADIMQIQEYFQKYGYEPRVKNAG